MNNLIHTTIIDTMGRCHNVHIPSDTLDQMAGVCDLLPMHGRPAPVYEWKLDDIRRACDKHGRRDLIAEVECLLRDDVGHKPPVAEEPDNKGYTSFCDTPRGEFLDSW